MCKDTEIVLFTLHGVAMISYNVKVSIQPKDGHVINTQEKMVMILHIHDMMSGSTKRKYRFNFLNCYTFSKIICGHGSKSNIVLRSR